MPQHHGYPGVWELAGKPQPRLLADYLQWLADNPDRFSSAAMSMQWLPVGLSALTIATKPDIVNGTVAESLQLNFYHPDYPGNEHPHGHSRTAQTVWYSGTKARQCVTRHRPLPHNARRLSGLPLSERQIVANSIVDKGDGGRPDYNPIATGAGLVLAQSVTLAAPLGSQKFGSLEVHHISFEGKDVAISVHHKGPEEPADLSAFEGLVSYKGLTPEQAEQVMAARANAYAQLAEEPSATKRLGPVTMVYPPLEFDLRDMEAQPTSTPPPVAETLLLGGLATAQALSKLM